MRHPKTAFCLALAAAVSACPAQALNETTYLETGITTVSFDLPSGTLIIDGTNFIRGGVNLAPYVELAGAKLTLVSATDTEIVAQLPAGAVAGEDQVYVERQDAANQKHHVNTDTGMRQQARYSLSLSAGWGQTGNAGTDANTNFIGTTDNQGFTVRVKNLPAMRFIPGSDVSPNQNTPNVIGGSSLNVVSGATSGATIGGGGTSDGINQVLGSWGTIAGGVRNTAGPNDVVGGGNSNTANSHGEGFATVGGGAGNLADNNSATVGGGAQNHAVGVNSVIAGGYENVANGYANAIIGGYANTTSNDFAVVGGGYESKALAANSFAAGTSAQIQATATGSWAWADNSANLAAFTVTLPNTFNVRAGGGTYIYSNATQTAGVRLPAGGGAWVSVSDRNAKTGFAPIDGRAVLDKLAAIPLSQWSYKSEDSAIHHMGPMAQDFYAAFGLGYDDKGITTIDADGVAFAAIQGLNARLDDAQRAIDAKQHEIDSLRAVLDETRATQAQLLEALAEVRQENHVLATRIEAVAKPEARLMETSYAP